MTNINFLKKPSKPKDVEAESLAALLMLAKKPEFRRARQLAVHDKRATVLHWLGHSTLLMQARGVTILTDPVWSSTLGPLGPRRLVPPVCAVEDLPAIIDVVLLSSSCYDHFDKFAVRRLIPRVTQWLVPLGMKHLLVDLGVRASHVQELDWWQKVSIDDYCFVCTPSQHTSKDQALWCSWAITNPYQRLFYCGGTGYRALAKSSDDAKTYQERAEVELPACPAFRDIGRRYGPFDVALLPIGGYSPRQGSSATQGDPLDMIFIHQDLRAKKSIGHRWGTFGLVDEGILDPVRCLESAIFRSPLPEHDFTYVYHGWDYST